MSLIDTLAHVSAGGPAWLSQIRQSAAERVKTSGLPHKKVEAWRFTPIAPLSGVAFSAGPTDSAETVAWVDDYLGAPVGARVVLINGALARVPDGAGVAKLSSSLEDPAVRDCLGQLAPAEHFAALNAALFDDGLVLRFARGAASTVEIVHVGVAGDSATVAYPRLLVLVEEGAEATLVETYLARGETKQLVSAVTEVSLAPAARLEHVRVTEGIASGFHIATLAVKQQRDSYYASRVVTLGGGLSRLDLRVLLAGQGAECVLDGAYHAAGKDVVDHHTRVDHAEPNCSSNEAYRGILDESGHAVFDATAVVRRDAQGTSAHQENRNLLLSDGAGVNTKPHLEIDADEVVCSHGATVGALDDEQLFYLRARGIGEDQATAMLTYAFIRSVLDSIRCEPVRERLAGLILDRLPHGEIIKATAREMTE